MLNEALAETFQFHAPRCDRVVLAGLVQDVAVLIGAAASGDRRDCPRCRGAWIRMIVQDRTQIVLRCMRCGDHQSHPSPHKRRHPASSRRLTGFIGSWVDGRGRA
jgi:hypothetical protein